MNNRSRRTILKLVIYFMLRSHNPSDGLMIKCIMNYFRQKIRIFYWCSFRSSIASGNFQIFRYNSFCPNDSYAKILLRLMGCTYHQAYRIIRKHPALEGVDHTRLIKAAEILKDFGIGSEELQNFPKVLTILPLTIEQRSLVLKESGFLEVTAKNVINYRTIVKRKISLLKVYGYLPEGTNVCQNLLLCVKAPDQVRSCVENSMKVDSNNATLSYLQDLVLSCYLQWRLSASKNEVQHIFSTYARVRNKSLCLIRETLSILLEELNFTKSHIRDHGYVIHAHPHDLRRILEGFPTLGKIPMRDFLYQHPIVAVTSYESFSQILKILLDAGISEEAIIQTPSIFSTTVENVRQGVALLQSEDTPPEVQALYVHPNMLRLVIYHDHVRQRLSYLSRCNHKSDLPPVASLNVLCGPHKMFERYLSGIGGSSKGYDVVNYLAKALGSEGSDSGSASGVNMITPASVRALLKQHVHWRSVPLSEIMSCLKMLISLGFTRKEVMNSLQILLYSPKKVEKQLRNLHKESELTEPYCVDVNMSVNEGRFAGVPSENPRTSDEKHIEMPLHIRKYALPLCLYFLEKEHHFTGNGIWFRQ